MPMYSLPTYAVIFFLSWPFSSLHICASDHRLVPSKLLYPGSILVSEDGIFSLGFFSPSNSTKKHYYVGIWYNGILECTIVWVSNRGAPITDLSDAKLAVTSSSNIVLSGSNGRLLWATNNSININSSSATTILAEAMLDNTGNFIHRSQADSAILWQSFDHPTDTLLPGMNLRISHKMHPLQYLVSWKGLQDPSSGDFSYGADPDNLLQRFVWHGSRPHRRSPVLGLNYTDRFKSIIYMALHHDHADDEVYMSFGMPAGSFVMLVRMKIDFSGKINMLSWDSNMTVWKSLYTTPAHDCNLYDFCGPYGYCDNTQDIPVCKCLDGFEPSDDKGWIAGRFSQGCRRKEVLRCAHGDGFLNIPGMKIPDKFLHVRSRSFAECTEECRSNCSCVAYAYSSMSTWDIDGDDTRCLVWMGELIDMENFTHGGDNLYLRINRLRGNKRKANTLEIVLPVVSSLVILICIGIIWICGFRGKRGSKEIWKRLMLGDTGTSNELFDRNVEFPVLSFREITAATNNFSESNILGHGGFGDVYKGTLGGDKEIAVKRLRIGSVQGAVEFKNEIARTAKLQHRNLVKVLGCCVHEAEFFLIYEYLPNRSLDAFIFNDTRRSLVGWPTRFKIIKGVARGLLYLHQDSRLMMIHRDLKASNVLLDSEMSPKIADFGTARIFGVNRQQEYTNRVVGTIGYMSPEYALEGVISIKSDVYSFGVLLLLEIVSGLKVSTTSPTAHFHNLIVYAWSLWKSGNLRNLVDSSIVESCSLDEALRCIHIGLLSVQDNPNSRPLISWVVSSIDNEAIGLPQPKEPVCFAQRNHGTGGEEESHVDDMSLGNLKGH